eukprot:scaffold263056_cov43-Tisochrysis_lutea.AAC.1
MLAAHSACGGNWRFGSRETQTTRGHPLSFMDAKESHYFTHIHGSASRDEYTATYVTDDCLSRCFVDGTPANFMSHFAPAKLRSIMTNSEAVRVCPQHRHATCR